MNIEVFLMEVLDNVIATIPQLTIVLTLVGSSLKKVKKNTKDFPDEVKAVKKEFNILKDDFKEGFDKSKKAMEVMLKDVAKEMKEGVQNVMSSMQTELNGYKAQLTRNNTQLSLLGKENKVFMEIIAEMVTKNPQLVKSGVAKVVGDKLNMTREELEKYTDVFIDNLPLLTKVIEEGVDNFGQEEIDAVLLSLGYEKNNDKV